MNFFKKLFATNPSRPNVAKTFRPNLEALGERIVPATFYWKGGLSGNPSSWSAAGNWLDSNQNPATVSPGATDDVIFNNSYNNTCNYTGVGSGVQTPCKSLTISGYANQLIMSVFNSFMVPGGTIDIDTLAVGSGRLELGTSTHIQTDLWDWTGGNINDLGSSSGWNERIEVANDAYMHAANVNLGSTIVIANTAVLDIDFTGSVTWALNSDLINYGDADHKEGDFFCAAPGGTYPTVKNKSGATYTVSTNNIQTLLVYENSGTFTITGKELDIQSNGLNGRSYYQDTGVTILNNNATLKGTNIVFEGGQFECNATGVVKSNTIDADVSFKDTYVSIGYGTNNNDGVKLEITGTAILYSGTTVDMRIKDGGILNDTCDTLEAEYIDIRSGVSVVVEKLGTIDTGANYDMLKNTNSISYWISGEFDDYSGVNGSFSYETFPYGLAWTVST